MLKVGQVIEVVKVIKRTLYDDSIIVGSQIIGTRYEHDLKCLLCIPNGKFYTGRSFELFPLGLFIRPEYIKPIGRLIVTKVK